MFNIIKIPRNYFTRQLLHDSNVAFHCSASHWRPYWEVSCSEEVFCRPSTAPVSYAERSRHHRRSQDFYWKCTLLLPEMLTTFFGRHSSHSMKCPWVKRHALLRSWGALSPSGVHLLLIPINLPPPIFSRPGLHLHPLHRLATPMAGIVSSVSVC